MTTMYPASVYDVTIHYEGRIPDFIGRVPACDEDQAKRIAYYDATNKGWPRDYQTIEATKLQE